MKRILSIFLVFLYLTSTAGVQFQAHYCHGEFSSFTFNPFHELTCGCEDESTMASCCDEAQFTLKIQDSHASSSVSTFQITAQHSEILTAKFEFIQFSQTHYFPHFINQFHELKPPDRCIEFGQFRI